MNSQREGVKHAFHRVTTHLHPATKQTRRKTAWHPTRSLCQQLQVSKRFQREDIQLALFRNQPQPPASCRKRPAPLAPLAVEGPLGSSTVCAVALPGNSALRSMPRLSRRRFGSAGGEPVFGFLRAAWEMRMGIRVCLLGPKNEWFSFWCPFKIMKNIRHPQRTDPCPCS